MTKHHRNPNLYLLCVNSVERRWVVFFWKGLPSAPVIICLHFPSSRPDDRVGPALLVVGRSTGCVPTPLRLRLSSTWVFRCDTAPSLLCLSFALLHPITLPSFHLISSALIAPLLSKNNTMVIIILCNKSNTQSRTKATHSNPRCTSYHNNMEFCFISLSCNNVKILHRLIHVCKC